MVIAVTCCEETAKILFEHRIEVYGRAYFGAACIIGEKTPGLSRTLHSDFQDFPGPENFTNTIPGAVGMIS